MVVNCFQISNFVLWQTAKRICSRDRVALWIAFKLVILSYDKQLIQQSHKEKIVVNCFQISNFVLWQTAFSPTMVDFITLWIAFKLVILSYDKQHMICRLSTRPVVNCFQISNFVLWQTARYYFIDLKQWLWIAFKLVILSYDKQQLRKCDLGHPCCELLSN